MALKPGERVVVVGWPGWHGAHAGAVSRGIPVTLIENDAPIDDRMLLPSSHRRWRCSLNSVSPVKFMKRADLADVPPRPRVRRPGRRVRLSQLADMTEFPYVIQYEQFKLVKTIMADIGDTFDVEYRFPAPLPASNRKSTASPSCSTTRTATRSHHNSLDCRL